jgi:hypothetical protein
MSLRELTQIFLRLKFSNEPELLKQKSYIPSRRQRRLNKNEVFERVLGFTLTSNKDGSAAAETLLAGMVCGHTNTA